jgi:SAM-dependent methyltransferase
VRGARMLGRLGWRQVAEASLVGTLWWYAAGVLYPAKALRRGGIKMVAPPVGEEPTGLPRPGLGRHFSNGRPAPVLLEQPGENGQLVEEFDELAEFYEVLVRPFSTPIFDEALAVIRRYLAPNSRVMDAGCGPGRELRRVVALVPEGEAVGVDLAAGMVKVAHASARTRGLDNCAFFQSDVYSCLAHHHYPDPSAAATGVLRCLRPGGIYCVIDPGPAWFNALSAPLGRLADPGWIGWKTPDEFRALMEGAGFTRICWIPLLPGFELAMGQKA